MPISKNDADIFMRQLNSQVDKKFNPYKNAALTPIISTEYLEFRKQFLPKHMTIYEKMCKIASVLNIKPTPKQALEIQAQIDTVHLNVTPTGAYSFVFFWPLLFMFGGAFLGYILSLLTNEPVTFFIAFPILIGLILMIPFMTIPKRLAQNWRLTSSNQMILSIFYIVTYMRHTSNIENAIKFASDHLNPPLGLDFKKIIWDVETEKFKSIEESLDHYLSSWQDYSSEYVESFHLIEGSLFESDDGRRLSMLDKSLEVMLNNSYEKMLHYAHNLKSPITMIHMLGVILPILGLVILPLAVSMIQGFKWYYIAALYNVLLPAGVLYLGTSVLSSRPSGYGKSNIGNNPALKKFKQITLNFKVIKFKFNPLMISVFILIFTLLIGSLPIILGIIQSEDQLLNEQPLIQAYEIKFLDYKEVVINSDTGETEIQGPFGLGAILLSEILIIGFGISFGLYYRLKSNKIHKIRIETDKLEKEFASALFQLGNRLGDRIPAEMAFDKVAESMRGTVSGRFMYIVSDNIRRLGMSVEQAIFDRRMGAIINFPSPIIESSMKVLTESTKKGPLIAAQALINISNYIKEIHRVNERLRDLMADVVSSMNMQIKFLAPTIAGVVIGITSMITLVLGKVGTKLGTATESLQGSGAPSINFSSFFGAGIPGYYFQIVVGLYVVQLVMILTVLVNGIQNGTDKLEQDYLLGKNLMRSTLLYGFISTSVLLGFTILASVVLSGLG